MKRMALMLGLGVFLTWGARVLAADGVEVAKGWWKAAGSNIFNTNAGNVGIGTSGPAAKLEVWGSADGSLDLVKLTNNYWAPNSRDETANIYAELGGEFGPGKAGKLTFGKLNEYADGASIDAFFAVSVADNNFLREYLRITNEGNVGIGTSDPSQRLEVNGNILVAGMNSLQLGSRDFGLGQQNWGDLGNYLTLKGYAGFAWVETRDNRAAMMLKSNGNLAIGTTAAGYRLTVAGDGSVSSGNHPVASFTRSYAEGVYLGYKADGTAASSGLIYTDNQLPLVIGSSNGEDYAKIERTRMEVGGGVKVNTLGNAKPACTDSERGMWWFAKGVGVSGLMAKDAVEVCARDINGTNGWRILY